MTINPNLTLALDELLGIDKLFFQKKAITPIVIPAPKTSSPNTIGQFSKNTFKEDIPEEKPPISKTPLTTIAKGLTVSGKIHSHGDLTILGTVVGEVICDNTVFFHGTLKGSIHANTIVAESGNIMGEIFAKEISMTKEVQLIGSMQIGK
ncbi:MAG: polymer-forming cytoskeletal protein [Eubacteriales bacterium]